MSFITPQSIYQSYLEWRYAPPEQAASYRALFLTQCSDYYDETHPEKSYLRDGVVLNEAEKIMNRTIWQDFPEALERLQPFAERCIVQLNQTHFLFFPSRLGTYIEQLATANRQFLDAFTAEYRLLEAVQSTPQGANYTGA